MDALKRSIEAEKATTAKKALSKTSAGRATASKAAKVAATKAARDVAKKATGAGPSG